MTQFQLARIALLSAAACHGSPPPVAPEAPPAPVQTASGDLARDPARDPALDADLGQAPPSKPQGAPIAITLAPPKVGDVRVRSVESRFVIRELGAAAAAPRQITETEIDLREELTAIDEPVPGEPPAKTQERAGLVLRVTVSKATEAMTLRDGRHDLTLLNGVYLVGALPRGGKHAAAVAREDHSQLYERELEELDKLYQSDDGRPSRLAQIVHDHPLRLGESIVLGDVENRLYTGEATVSEPIAVTLVERAGPDVIVQVDAVSRLESGATRTLRSRARLQIATGRLLELRGQRHDLGDGSDEKLVETVRFGYPPN